MKISSIKFRRAELTDHELLSRLRIDFMEDHWGKQEEAEREKLRQNLLPYYQNALKDGNYCAFLAFENEKCAGTGGMVIQQRAGSFRVPNGRVAYLMNMFTYPAYRRHGIAKQILELLESEARRIGIEVLELHATASGEPLYKQNGFLIHPEPTMRKLLTASQTE